MLIRWIGFVFSSHGTIFILLHIIHFCSSSSHINIFFNIEEPQKCCGIFINKISYHKDLEPREDNRLYLYSISLTTKRVKPFKYFQQLKRTTIVFQICVKFGILLLQMSCFQYSKYQRPTYFRTILSRSFRGSNILDYPNRMTRM